MPHVYLWVWVFGCKQTTMHACRLEDGFTNELFKEISGGQKKWEKRKTNYMHAQATGQIPAERWNTEKEEPDKNANKELLVWWEKGKEGRGDSWHTAESKSTQSTEGGLWWKSNLSQRTEKFGHLWIFQEAVGATGKRLIPAEEGGPR